jgi:hypothetical protein
MRQLGIEGTYTFVFELRVMPRRGEERTLRGQMWGSRTAAGPVFRYEIWEPGRQQDRVLRFLAQNGPEPELWFFDTASEADEARPLRTSELFTPIQGTDFVPFDLQMPFLFWNDFAYEGLRRVRGRSSHAFLMYAPEELRREFSWLEGVRMFLDAEFNAVSSAEIVNAAGETIRSFQILDIKGLDNQWFPRSIDYRDARTGDRTRLSIQAAALNLPAESFPFLPQTLSHPFPVVPRDRLTFF